MQLNYRTTCDAARLSRKGGVLAHCSRPTQRPRTFCSRGMISVSRVLNLSRCAVSRGSAQVRVQIGWVSCSLVRQPDGTRRNIEQNSNTTTQLLGICWTCSRLPFVVFLDDSMWQFLRRIEGRASTFWQRMHLVKHPVDISERL